MKDNPSFKVQEYTAVAYRSRNQSRAQGFYTLGVDGEYLQMCTFELVNYNTLVNLHNKANPKSAKC